MLPDGACTLVAPGWAITAAHVAASIAPGAQVAFGDRTATVKRAVLHPEGTAQRGVPPEVDLALLELTAAVQGVAPLPLYRGRDELGASLVIVGYGDFGTPHGPLTRTDGRRRAATNVVVDAGPRRLFMKFDAPPEGTSLEGVGGPGDSGGPALVDVGGKWQVAGISSASMDGKPGQYGVTDVYTRVGSYVEWIDTVSTVGDSRRRSGGCAHELVTSASPPSTIDRTMSSGSFVPAFSLARLIRSGVTP